VYGGFVRWEMGKRADGEDSIASQVVAEDHWPEMDVLILVVRRSPLTRASHTPLYYYFVGYFP